MIRTQVQLPDPLHRRLKALAADQEWSLAEAMRRAAELLLRSYPQERAPDDSWELPKLALGGLKVPLEDLRTHANEREPEGPGA